MRAGAPYVCRELNKGPLTDENYRLTILQVYYPQDRFKGAVHTAIWLKAQVSNRKTA